MTRADLNGHPVYQVSPRLDGGGKIAGHLLYLHGGAYVLDLLPYFHWPAIAKLATALRRTVTVPIFPISPEHTYREVFPFLLQVYRRELDDPRSHLDCLHGRFGGRRDGFRAMPRGARSPALPAPTDAVLLSPWMHLALPDPDVPVVAKIDPFLNPEDLRAAGIR